AGRDRGGSRAGRDDDPPDHPLPRGGRAALRPRGDHAPRPDRRLRHAGGAGCRPRARCRHPRRRLPGNDERRAARRRLKGLTMTSVLAPLGTLARRRMALTIRTPRELFVPLLTPILFAVVIAPALKSAVGGLRGSAIDYEAFVALATVGLLIPLNAMFSGIGVIVDRETGARRELLAAPIRRPLLVFGNLAVTLAVTALQLVALIVAAVARGVGLQATASGIVWFVAAAILFCI